MHLLVGCRTKQVVSILFAKKSHATNVEHREPKKDDDGDLDCDGKMLDHLEFILLLKLMEYKFDHKQSGPRNLNAKTDKKEKSTIVRDENEFEETTGDVEEEEELQEHLILEKEDELSDIDLGDDE
ncbi:hypothetical protein E2542_SST16192 [Spatholobus suberectus]|nr:hypothetical protein E2542_SST16192 [Spatholobus suberectus]